MNSCPECGNSFSSLDELVKHQTTHSQNDQDNSTTQSPGPVVLLVVPDQEDDKAPNKSVTNDDITFACPNCENRFSTSDQLENHQKIHNNNDGTQPSDLIQHTEDSNPSNLSPDAPSFHVEKAPAPIETSVKIIDIEDEIMVEASKYQCAVCDQTFTSSDSVNSHFTRHTDGEAEVTVLKRLHTLENMWKLKHDEQQKELSQLKHQVHYLQNKAKAPAHPVPTNLASAPLVPSLSRLPATQRSI